MASTFHKIEVLIHYEGYPDDYEQCHSYIVLHLLGHKILLVIIHQVVRSLSSLESVLHQGAHALILLFLSLLELTSSFLLLTIPPLLKLSFHFIVSEGFLALLHTTDVLEILLLDPLELLDNRGVS